MSALPADATFRQNKLDTLWFTRCPVPTATGLAYKLGWLTEEFQRDGIKIETLQESGRVEFNRHHYDHGLTSLIREGGNMLAIGARGQGAPTKLIGLTWIEEWQSILVRADSGITEPAHLKGKRLALPTYSAHPIPDHLRGCSIARGMSLAGYRGVLASAGLTFDDVELVQTESRPNGDGLGRRDFGRIGRLWPIAELVEGKVDAVYVKGASAADAAHEHGVVVGIDLDKLPDPRFRVNNGTPRPITAHQDLLDDHFDLVVRFMEQTLRAADWAAENLEPVLEIFQAETLSSKEAAEEAYRDGFHRSLHPDLSPERLDLFNLQKKFLWLHGFLDRDFDLADWVDARPLEEAHKRISNHA